ncbi:MAG TPA: glycosyltransferase family 39 protein [bacterium]|nr:glycosyltransferase family 39 protein [bacterium]
MAVVHIVGDGRMLLDHDLFFYQHFLFSNYYYMDNPGLYTSLLEYFTDYTNESCYVLPNLVLHLIAGVVPVSLYFLRTFNLVFLLLFLWGSWKIGEQLADRRAGWLCVVAALSLPIFDDYSRSYDFHFHALAFLLPAHALLLAELGKISSWSRYALIGACVGLAISTHTISLLESAPIFLFAALNLYRKLRHNPQWIARLGAMILFTLLTAVPVFNGLYDYYLAKSVYLLPTGDGLTPLVGSFNASLLAGMIDEFVGLRFLILGGVLTLLSLFQWIGKRRFRFQDFYMGFCVAFYAALALDIILNGGNKHDGMIFYAMILPWLIATTHSLFAAAGMRRAVALLTAAVLLIGVWEKAESLRVFPLSGRAVNDEVRPDSRRWLNVQKDWMWASNDALSQMNIPRHASVDCRAYDVDTDGSIDERNSSIFIHIFSSVGSLFGRRLDCENPDLPPSLRFEMFLLPEQPPPPSVIAALSERLRGNGGETRYLYFTSAKGQFGLGVYQALIVITKLPPTEETAPSG